MRILLIGSGARENAVFNALKRSKHNPEIIVFAPAKNPGMLDSIYEIGNIEDLNQIKEVARKHNPDFAFIGPDNPIGLGAADALEELTIPSVGPKRLAAQVESSKSFTRDLLEKYNIVGNPKYKVFTNTNEIKDYITQELDEQYVVKYDGLLGGKGVKVSGEHLETIEDGLKFAEECLQTSDKVTIEEKMIGPEFSLMSFADGQTIKSMPAVQDHKRAFNGDKGPNTGGMGTYSDANHLLPFLDQSDIDQAKEITEKVMHAIKEETNQDFKGIMFGGFMKTKNGVRLIEFNARFGDPEALNVLPILKTDFVDICQAIINQDLKNIEIEFENLATVCLYIVPEGYPGNVDKDPKSRKLTIKKHETQNEIFYSSVNLLEETDSEIILEMSTSRALGLVGLAPTINEALTNAKTSIPQIEGKIRYRTDIGTPELIKKRIDLVNSF